MVERIMFKGRTAEQAAVLSDGDFNRLVNSRARRWLKRNSLNYRELMEKVKVAKAREVKRAIRTHTREALILPSFIGLDFEVYDGKVFQKVRITANMIGHRLGEFAHTTKRVQHSNPGIKATRGSKFLSVK